MTNPEDSVHKLEALAEGGTVDPGFSHVIAFDFYDGAESGLAIYECGAGVRFASLGDSRSGLHRAFELCGITGNWRAAVETVLGMGASTHPSRFFLPPTSEHILNLQNDVSDAACAGYFVGVGSPYLETLKVARVSEKELVELRGQQSSIAAFDGAHKIVKETR